MKTIKLLQEFLENYGGEPDYEIKVVQFDGKEAAVSYFTYDVDTKELKIHTEKI